MSKVLIVSRTKMRENRVCVGGIDLDKNLSIRLLDQNGHHEGEVDCPYEIGDIWECFYTSNHKRPAPHLEDSNINSRSLLQKQACSSKSDFIKILSEHSINIFRGNIDNCFNGCLVKDEKRYYVSHDNVPQYSTCFWINDFPLKCNDYQKPEGGIKKQLAYLNGSSPWGKTIAYVGLGDTPKIVSEGALIRLSLANWWSKDINTPERCYLQISWIYK